MKKHALWALAVLCGGALFAGGCATHSGYTSGDLSTPSASSQSGQYREKSVKINDGAAKINAGNMAAGAPRTAQTAVVKTETPSAKGVKLDGALEKIYFDFDATTLSEQARASLANNAERLRKNPAVTVRIEGHCDERGSDEYNLALGEKRAKTAMQYFMTMGIPAKRLSVLSYGKEKPADSGHDEAAWSKNRRDEFVVTSK